MRRRKFLGGLGAVAVCSVHAHAQQPRPIARVGLLTPDNTTAQPWAIAFREGLEKLGWVEGRNLKIDHRWSDGGDGLRVRAEELAATAPDVILAGTASSLVRVKAATSTVPIVFAYAPDPVNNGFVTNLSRPGGNITGFANYEHTIGVKWLELLTQIAPRVMRAIFIYDPANPGTTGYLRAAEASAPSFGLSVSGALVRNSEEIERVVGAFASDPDGGLIVLPGPATTGHRGVVEVAARHRIPAIFPFNDFVKAGALASYGVDPEDLFRRAASYVDRILRGEKPGDLPIQFASKYVLSINIKTAKALGLEVPVSLLARTDEVIE